MRNNKLWIVHILLIGFALLGAVGVASVPALAMTAGEGCERGLSDCARGQALQDVEDVLTSSEFAESGRMAENRFPESIDNEDVTPPTIDRDLEPVVVPGAQLYHLWGTPTDSIFVYAYQNGSLQQIPFQVDEVEAGSYDSTVGSPLDDDDEVVFMASDLGARLWEEEVITATLPISNTWYRVMVTDPLDRPSSGWAYIVRSSSLTETFTETYASFDLDTDHITSTEYALGFLENYAGLDYLALQGSGEDILDRTKMRFKWPEGTLTLVCTEECLAGPTPFAVKNGPVRVIVENRRTIGYRSLIHTWVTEERPDLTEARFSTDFNENAVDATLYNANRPQAGVRIDGFPFETIPGTPLSAWWEMADDTGTLVQVADSSGMGGIQTNYYKDDAREEDWRDTGDERSYGDVGIKAEDPDEVIDYWSAFFVLPADAPNVGRKYYNYVTHPLEVSAVAPMTLIHDVYFPWMSRGFEALYYDVYFPLVIRQHAAP